MGLLPHVGALLSHPSRAGSSAPTAPCPSPHWCASGSVAPVPLPAHSEPLTLTLTLTSNWWTPTLTFCTRQPSFPGPLVPPRSCHSCVFSFLRKRMFLFCLGG